jgi:hypothetical protein
MSTYNTKNYTEQGGDVTHIGGKLIIEDGAVVEGLDAANFEQAAAVADATDDAVTTVNALLASLRAAGILAAE